MDWETRDKERKEWLASLKIGDTVMVPARYAFGMGALHKISRETPTRLYYRVNEHAESWVNKKDGYGKRGDVLSGTNSIQPVTPEFLEKIERQDIINSIDSQLVKNDWRQFPKDRLKFLLAALQEIKT